MESKPTVSSEDKTALGQLQQKASNLHQSSSNNFLVALEGLMLAAIAWESLDKPKAWLRNLSKGTTAIGLGVTAIFTYNAIRDLAKASKADSKLKQFGMDEFTLPSEIKQVAPVSASPAADLPSTTIQAEGREVSRLHSAEPQMAM